MTTNNHILTYALLLAALIGRPGSAWPAKIGANLSTSDTLARHANVLETGAGLAAEQAQVAELRDATSGPQTLSPSAAASTTEPSSSASTANVTSGGPTRFRHEREPLVLDPRLQLIAGRDQSPRSDKQQVLDSFGKFFLKARSHDDQQQKEIVRDGIIERLRELGFESSFLQKSRFEFRRRQTFSYNIVSILPGRHRHTQQEQIVLVGAHWDSATKAPGVDDNGSGSVCLLEIARLISEKRCQFNHTVMLVWFDYEEQGKLGSEFFVNDYLFPLELEKYGSHFIGAYIMDMILVRDRENNTQTLPPNIKNKLVDFNNELEREKSRGDFLASWARKTWDEPLDNAFLGAWLELGFERRTFKSMQPELPQARMPNSEERYEWKDFFRSDHASFWFPPITSSLVRRAPNRTSTAGHSSLNAVLLTDLGPWRKSYSKCYHASCDDEHLLTDGNLAFMQQVTDSLVLTLLRVAQGFCSSLPTSTTSTSTTSTSTTSTSTTSTTSATSTTTSTTTNNNS